MSYLVLPEVPDAQLHGARHRLEAGDTQLQPAYDNLIREAEAALEAGPWSVVEDDLVPPSGDPHDYTSLGPYWWPDPDQVDGLPWVRHDGQRNPQSAAGDRKALNDLSDAVSTLALAWYLRGKQAYAEHAGKLLRTFFLDPATRMNPHLRFGQRIPGKLDGRGIGIIDTIRLVPVVEAARLLSDAEGRAWTEEDQRGLKAWFGAYLDWLQQSPLGQAEARHPNNHGTWYDVQVATFALFTGRTYLAQSVLETVPTTRIKPHIAPDGRQPRELQRTLSLTYSSVNLQGLSALAQLAQRLGIDLWHFRDRQGRSIHAAATYMMPYLARPDLWPHPQIEPAPLGKLALCLRLASRAYGEPHLERTPSSRGHQADWLDHPFNLVYLRPPTSTQRPMHATPKRVSTAVPGEIDHAGMTIVALPPDSQRTLDQVRDRLGDDQSDPQLLPAYHRVIEEADAALHAGPWSVVDDEAIAPSGDPHDYMSQAPYLWPNPETPDGLPYVTYDGQRNPESIGGDKAAKLQMLNHVRPLILAWSFARKPAYAEHAARLLRTFFLDPATRMNPNLNYAQAIPGRCEGRGIGIIDTARMTGLVALLPLLGSAEAWTDEDDNALQAWFSEFLRWLEETEFGERERQMTNNHGTWYDAQAVAFALYSGQPSKARAVLEQVPQQRIIAQIEPDGRQPRELGRTRSLQYSAFNLQALTALASFGEHFGIDLWNFEDQEGRGIRAALNFLGPYLPRPEDWSSHQIDKPALWKLAAPLRLAARAYQDPWYEHLIQTTNPVLWQDDPFNLVYPPG